MSCKNKTGFYETKKGSVLVLMMASIVVLAALGVGMLGVAYGVRRQAIMVKNETAAMLAAEAGYEAALLWMTNQTDVQLALPPTNTTHNFGTSRYSFTITPYTAIKRQIVYEIKSTGYCGVSTKTVSVKVLKAIRGWEMGMCRIPGGTSSTWPVYFMTGEKIYMPLHINSYAAPGDSTRDIHISGSPDFQERVSFGESYVNSSKYPTSVMNLFDEGASFDQTDSKITDSNVISKKLADFKTDTNINYQYTPTADTQLSTAFGSSNTKAAVQIEFYVDANNKGQVVITNDCTVRGYNRSTTLDYKIDPAGSGSTFERYKTYAYHFKPTDSTKRVTARSDDQTSSLYVTPSFGGEKGGQIFIDGDVIIGGNRPEHSERQMIQGGITIAATGNIWIADSTWVSDKDSAGTNYAREERGTGTNIIYVPGEDNPNVLGLMAGGVIKVIDPGVAEYAASSSSNHGYPGPPNIDPCTPYTNSIYEPVGIDDTSSTDPYARSLEYKMRLEAGITVGGGGWGAENVVRSSKGGRKQTDSNGDKLYLVGVITEAMRGVVGNGDDGYKKQYYLDDRMLEGILPGDPVLSNEYIPAPAGWHDYVQ